MLSTNAISRPLRFAIITVLLFISSSRALSISYCSPTNDAGNNLLVNNYMSNGKCQDNCKASYVFAVIQGTNCWCSNYAPSNTVDNGQCNVPCPGYPYETCGNSDQGLYAYFNLGGSPSGTSGGNVATSQTSSRSNTSPASASVITSVISITGKASTILITSIPTSTSDSSLGQSTQVPSKGESSLSGGAVAGIVIGVALAIGLGIGCGVFFWLRKKHARNLEAVSEGGSVAASSHGVRNNGTIPSRQVSQMSSAGLLARPARSNTAGLSENSNAAGTINSDRNSSHMTVDQRLNPWAIYSTEVSRVSNVSLQDNQDYSRQLRVANPDP